MSDRLALSTRSSDDFLLIYECGTLLSHDHAEHGCARTVYVSETRLVQGLAAMYRDEALAISRLCDDHLDRSGRLLGEVRKAARNG